MRAYNYQSLEAALQAAFVLYDIHCDAQSLLESSKPNSSDEDLLRHVLSSVNVEYEKINPNNHSYNSQYPLLLKKNENNFFLVLPKNIDNSYTDQTEFNLEDGYDFIFAIRAGRNKNIDKLSWFLSPLKQYKSQYREIAIISFFINLLALSIPLYSMNLYDRVVSTFAIETLFALTIGVVLALICDLILRSVRSYVVDYMSEGMSIVLDIELMKRYWLIPQDKMHMSDSEKVHLFYEMQVAREYFSIRLIPAAIDAPFAIFYFIAIAMICLPLTLIPLMFTVLIVAMSLMAQHSHVKDNIEVFETSSIYSSIMNEYIRGNSAIRSASVIGEMLHRWEILSKNLCNKKRRAAFGLNNIQFLSNFLIQSSQIALLFFGVFQINQGDLSIGGLVAISILSGRALSPVFGLSSLLSSFKKNYKLLVSLDKIFSMNSDYDIATKVSQKSPFKGDLELKKISYSYRDREKNALKEISLKIDHGGKVGIVGPNGAGKSTLANVLAGTLSHQDGSVSLDGHPFSTISPFELRRVIGYVPQSPVLFNASIRDNIIMGSSNVSMNNLDQGLFLSGVHKWLSETGLGLDFKIGENGLCLSMGQRQSLSLARALVRNPKILILDEPIAGMDYALENHIKQHMKNFLVDKTFILITHRTSLLDLVDHLILLDRGEVKSIGHKADIMSLLSGGQKNV